MWPSKDIFPPSSFPSDVRTVHAELYWMSHVASETGARSRARQTSSFSFRSMQCNACKSKKSLQNGFLIFLLSLWIRFGLSFSMLSKTFSLSFLFFSFLSLRLISLSLHVVRNGLVSFTTALAARGLIDKKLQRESSRWRLHRQTNRQTENNQPRVEI